MSRERRTRSDSPLVALYSASYVYNPRPATVGAAELDAGDETGEPDQIRHIPDHYAYNSETGIKRSSYSQHPAYPSRDDDLVFWPGKGRQG